MEDKREQQTGIMLPTDIADGVYSNLALITHSSSEFILDFIDVLPGMPQPKVKARVVLAPEHAKRLMLALKDNVQKYEDNFGEIELRNMNPSSDVAPFKMPAGEA